MKFGIFYEHHFLEDICSSLELFAREVMPEFHDREPAHQEWKKAVLADDIVLSELSTSEHSYRRATLRTDATESKVS